MATQDRAEIIEILRQCVAMCAAPDGWANLAEIGGKLRERGVKYGKLSKFMHGYAHVVETKLDETVSPPVAYARLKG